MTIESIFFAALKRGPVILLDNMNDRTHAATHDPLVDNSPLIRLAILAVDLGADPDTLWFDGKVHPRSGPGPWSAAAVMYNVGADSPELDRALRSGVPAIGFHYCTLNAMFFVDEFGAYGQRIKAHHAKDGNENVRDPFVWIEPQPAKLDRAKPEHLRVVERVHVYFNNQGWHTAAERLQKCMEPQSTPVEIGAGVTASVDAQGTMTITSETTSSSRPGWSQSL